ncbi:hypothetical protein VKT23_020440 [Stygiomarasmius scandens]|uniref:Uncharacterized protein n=1 Tax=Marasmiellus scandens TaxID=2682957 RepID=A0ABR1IMZ2_9AGAR
MNTCVTFVKRSTTSTRRCQQPGKKKSDDAGGRTAPTPTPTGRDNDRICNDQSDLPTTHRTSFTQGSSSGTFKVDRGGCVGFV